MRADIAALDLPDPMHPKPWEEKDEPLASDLHYDSQDYVRDALRVILDPTLHYVTRDRWLHMDPANPRDRLLPDLLVALDVPAARRDPDEFIPREVGKPPDLLGEILSPSSEVADEEGKPKRYARLGVREYFLFDVVGVYDVSPVQGWRLRQDGSREPLPSDSEGGVMSEVLPVRFVFRDGWLQVEDTRTGDVVPRHRDFQRRLEDIEVARLQAEAENERLRAENERLRRERGDQ